MKRCKTSGVRISVSLMLLLGGFLWVGHACQELQAGPPWRFGGRWTGWGFYGREHQQGPQALGGTWYRFPRTAPGHGQSTVVWEQGGDGACEPCPEIDGHWYWMRSPEEERTIVASLFNRYCIRCHGVDGRGVWDIPGVPNFTDVRWQVSRSNDQIARIIIQGRGAVMPTFRGALTLEEAWAMARYLRTFVPGSQPSRPETGKPTDPAEKPELAPPPQTTKPPEKVKPGLKKPTPMPEKVKPQPNKGPSFE